MDINSRLSISFYKTIATVNEAHKIYVVQHIQTQKIYLKKILDVYNKSVYDYLISNPIAHTPQIFEIYEEDNQLTIIEEYISGDTIEQLMNNGTFYSFDDIIKIATQLCQIVKSLHACNPPIIHRDIKPSNIIISNTDELYLLDFNAAKYYSDKAEDTTLLGTKGYAAPEQYGFGVSTTQTDIYSIGMLLKDLITNNTLLSEDDYIFFEPIISKCTKLSIEDRYASIDEILKILNEAPVYKVSGKKKLPDWLSFLPPGFRTLSPIKIVLSTIGYAFIFWLCLTLEVKGATPISLFIERIFCLFMFLSIIFASANYRNLQMLFPPCRTQNKLLRFISVILLDILLMFAFMFTMTFIVATIS